MTREAEWDADELAKMLELGMYEAGVCDCGFHSSLTSDKANHFAIEVETCNVCAAADLHDRLQAAADEKFLRTLGEKPAPGRKRPSDGRHRRIRPVDAPAEPEQPAQPGGS